TLRQGQHFSAPAPLRFSPSDAAPRPNLSAAPTRRPSDQRAMQQMRRLAGGSSDDNGDGTAEPARADPADSANDSAANGDAADDGADSNGDGPAAAAMTRVAPRREQQLAQANGQTVDGSAT